MHHDHPDPDQLKAFALGQLEPDSIEEIGQHLAECEECCETLQNLPGDTFVSRVRDIERTHPKPAPTTPEQTIDLPGTPADKPALAPTLAESGRSEVRPSPNTVRIDAGLIDHQRYHILEPIGQGGMGAVYRAEHRMMRRTVALKVIHQRFVANPSAVDRFHREVQAAAKLQHPNIVTAYDAEQAGDSHFLVMEYVPGTDLAQVLRDRGPLAIADACDYVRQAALGLQHAHEQGMVHRDIKPQNLMLTPAGQVKILDFGLASLTGEETTGDTGLTERGVIMGTPDYIAPEQARDTHSADIRADIYSLGCTLYTLLTGQPPFPDAKALDKIMAHVERRPAPVSDARPDVPPKLAAVLDKMMAKDPTDRYQTPAEVADALAEIRPELRAKRQAKRRWPLVTTLATAAALFLVVLGAIVVYLQTPTGTVRIEINDPAIKVGFAGDTYTIDNKGETIKITPGEHTLRVERGDLKFETPKFTLGQGDNPALRVEFFQGKLTVKVGDTVVSRHLGTPAVAEGPGGTKGDITLFREFEQVHPFFINSVAVTPDGRYALSGMHQWPDNSLLMWDVATGKLVHRFSEVRTPIGEVAVSGDGKYAAAGGIKLLYIWDLPGRKLLHPPINAHESIFMAVAISADNNYVLTAGYDKTACVWDLKTGKELCRIRFPQGCGDAAFLPDGQVIVAAGRTELWDWKANIRVRTFGSDSRSIDVSDDGQYLLEGNSDGVISLYAVKSAILLKTFTGHGGHVKSLRFLPDQKHFASGSEDGTLRVLSLATGAEIARRDSETNIFRALTPTPDGRHVIAGGGYDASSAGDKPQGTGDYALRLWRLPESVWPKAAAKDDTPPVRHFVGHTSPIREVAFSPDGKLAVSLDKAHTIRLWDVATGQEKFQLKGHLAIVEKVGFSSRGDQVFSASYDKTVRLWDVNTGRELRRFVLPGIVNCAVFSPDGRYIFATVKVNQKSVEAVVYDTDTETVVANLGPCLSRALAVSPDGQRALVGIIPDGGFPRLPTVAFLPSILVWDIKKAKAIHTISCWGQPFSFAFLPDSRRFVVRLWGVGGSWYLWDGTSGKELKAAVGHANPVLSLAMTPDGRLLITRGYNTLRVWDVEKARELWVQRHDEPAMVVAISPDGRQVLSASGKRLENGKVITGKEFDLHLWQLPESVWKELRPAQE